MTKGYWAAWEVAYLKQVEQMLIGFQLFSLFFTQCFQTSPLFVQHHHVRELFLVLLGKFFAMRNNILERKNRYRFHSEKFLTSNTGKQLHLSHFSWTWKCSVKECLGLLKWSIICYGSSFSNWKYMFCFVPGCTFVWNPRRGSHSW